MPGLLPMQEAEDPMPRRPVPDPRRVARARFIVQACGREVTVGDAPAATLAEIRQRVRDSIGKPAVDLGPACDELTDRTLYFWPERQMADYARKKESSGPATLDAVAVISAKVREDAEARWGLSANVTNALDLLAMAVACEVANIWFSSVEERIGLRRAIAVVRHRVKS